MATELSKPVEATTETFDHEVIDSDVPVVIDFWAPWCAPCRAVSPILHELAAKWAGQVKVVKLNIDEEPAIAQAFKVRSIPTLVAMRGKDVVDVQIGVGGKNKLEHMFSQLAGS